MPFLCTQSASLLVYNRELSAAEIQDTERWLVAKYSLGEGRVYK